MKIFLIFIMVLFFSALMAQTDTASDSEVISDEVTTEAAATDEVEDKVDEVSDVPYEKSDCVCPENEVQQQEASIFAPGSVFMVTPLAPEEEKESENKNVIPGYIENLEPGFDDKSYKQIPFKE
jgi:hypothetical protein